MRWFVGGVEYADGKAADPLHLPKNVQLEFLPAGETLENMLCRGEIDGALFDLLRDPSDVRAKMPAPRVAIHIQSGGYSGYYPPLKVRQNDPRKGSIGELVRGSGKQIERARRSHPRKHVLQCLTRGEKFELKIFGQWSGISGFSVAYSNPPTNQRMSSGLTPYSSASNP